MKKYIDLKICGNPSEITAYLEVLKHYVSDAFNFAEIRDATIAGSTEKYIEFIAKRTSDYKSRLILLQNEGSIQMCNIIPNTVSFIEIEQYNSILRHFYEDVIEHTKPDALKVEMSKEENSMQDLISSSAYDALILWEESCNKNSPVTHPNDRKRWLNFICELSLNKDRLSLSDFRNWLIEDRGWYYNPIEEDKTINELELELEFGLDLIDYYEKKNILR